MNGKKQQILEAAMKCFAQKGFKETSIQDIVDEVGIAKGSVYIYFKSKEDLLISALRHAFERMAQEMDAVSEDVRLSPREVLERQIRVQFKLAEEYGDFIRTLILESAVSLDEKMEQFLREIRSRTFQWVYRPMEKLYGNRLEPYMIDAIMLYFAMLGQMVEMLVIYNIRLDMDRLPEFILDRLDDVVEGMIKRGRPPMMTPEMVLPLQIDPSAADARSKWRRILDTLREMAEADDLPANKRSELESYLFVLQREGEKPAPNPAVIHSIVGDLKSFGIVSWSETLDELLSALPNEGKSAGKDG